MAWEVPLFIAQPSSTPVWLSSSSAKDRIVERTWETISDESKFFL